MNLVAELQALDLQVIQQPGWQKRGKPGFFPKGILLHHTAGAYRGPGQPVQPSLGIIVNGRRDVPPPLCHLYIDRLGRVQIIAGRKANHAGACSLQAVQEAAKGLVGAHTKSARARALKDDAKGMWSGNVRLWGIEVEHSGDLREPWMPHVVESTCRTAAALCLVYGWTAGHVTLHRNVTARKIDPYGSTDWWTRIAAIIKENK